jgi:hypothetical protein
MDNLKREITQPEKHPANPLIGQDKPWEARFLEIYGTVLYEPRRALFRCWYLASEHNGNVPDTPQHPKTAEYVTCYAKSRDGIVWSKPLIGPKPYGSRTEHNIVIEGSHGFCVLPDPEEPNPARRYKGAGGPLFGWSPDGIQWETRDWRPAVGKNDTSSCVIRWNDEYLAYVRAQVSEPDWPGVMRGIGLSTSADFEEWTPKTTIFTTDTADGYPWTQPYGISVTPYGDILIGILWMLHLDPLDKNNSIGEQDTQLVVSRDGRTWQRVADREVFLAPTPGTWDKGGVFPGTTMFVKDDRVHIYYTGRRGRHGEGLSKMAIGLATLPAERFVALRQVSVAKSGTLRTPPLAFSGSELVINAELLGGELEVELLNSHGAPLGAFSAKNSRLRAIDPVRYRVVWESGDKMLSLDSIRGDAPVMLRFILKGSALYAFQIREIP